MKKILNWVAGIGAVIVVLVVLLSIILQQVGEQREAALGPLSEATLQALNPKASGHAEHIDPGDDEVPVPSMMESAPETTSMETTRLSRTLTEAELFRDYRPENHPMENFYRYLRDHVNEAREHIAWSTETDDNGTLAMEIGSAAFSKGNIEKARDYMRAALETSVRNGDYSYRHYICGRLAWLEDDPEVAAALLEASCTINRPIDEVNHARYLQNALCLSIVTGSDDLAEHYYARWNAIEPVEKETYFSQFPMGRSPEVAAWLEARDPDFFDNATPWDPFRHVPEVE